MRFAPGCGTISQVTPLVIRGGAAGRAVPAQADKRGAGVAPGAGIVMPVRCSAMAGRGGLTYLAYGDESAGGGGFTCRQAGVR